MISKDTLLAILVIATPGPPSRTMEFDISSFGFSICERRSGPSGTTAEAWGSTSVVFQVLQARRSRILIPAPGESKACRALRPQTQHMLHAGPCQVNSWT